jgi:hypothetical protein
MTVLSCLRLTSDHNSEILDFREGFKMNMVDRFFFYAACLSVAGFCLFYVAHQQDTGPATVKCTVARVVDDETDEPVVNERHKRPYTVLHYQPAHSVFDLPGDLGEPGQIVYVIPPKSE